MVDPKKIQAAPSLIQPPGPTGTTIGLSRQALRDDALQIEPPRLAVTPTRYRSAARSRTPARYPTWWACKRTTPTSYLPRALHRSREGRSPARRIVFAHRPRERVWNLAQAVLGRPSRSARRGPSHARAGWESARASGLPTGRAEGGDTPDGARGQGDSAGSTGPCKRGQRCRGHDHSRCPGHGRGAAGRGPRRRKPSARSRRGTCGRGSRDPSPKAAWYRARSRCRTVGSTPGHGWT